MSAATSRGRISAKCALVAAAVLFAAGAAQAYEVLEYIESTGTQWINTGIAGNQAFGLRAGIAVTGVKASWQSLIGGKLDDFTIGTQNSHRGGCYLRYRTSEKYNNITSVLSDSACTDVAITNGLFTIDGVTKASGLSGAFDTTSTDIAIINNGAGSRPSKMRVYYLQLFDASGELLADLIPARSEEGCAGLLDRKRNEFFGNAGTGKFIEGPVVVTEGLWIDGSPEPIGTPSPDYGVTNNLVAGETYTFTCPAAWSNATETTSATVLAKCTGFTLALTNGEEYASAALSTSIVYSAEAACSTLTWLWDVYYRVAATASAHGSVAVSSEWLRSTDKGTVTATPDDGCVFVKWTGDVPSGYERVNPLTLSPTAPISLTAQFASVVTKTVKSDGSGDYATLSEALADLNENLPSGSQGEIVLTPGNYELTATALVEAPITIRSSTRNAADVVVYANRKASNFPVFQLAAAEAKLFGLSISNGYATTSYTGGGVTVGTEAFVEGCRIVSCGCSGTDRAAGLVVSGGVVRASLIANCDATAVCLLGGSLVSCVVTNNFLSLGGYYGYGAAVYAKEGDNLVSRCLIADNSYGGDSYGNPWGAGVTQHGGTLRLERSTIAFNNGAYNGPIRQTSGTLTTSGLVVWGNTSVFGSEITWLCSEEDPLFVNPTKGDYRLASNSPLHGNGCYDQTGDEPAVAADETDEVSVAEGGDINAAIVKCRAGGTVRVGPGAYPLVRHGVYVLKGVRVVSDEGPERTTLYRVGASAENRIRQLYVGDADAVVSGFTFTNTFNSKDSAANVALVRNGTLTNCVVTKCTEYSTAQLYDHLVGVNKGFVRDLLIHDCYGGSDRLGGALTLLNGSVAECCVISNHIGAGAWASPPVHLSGGSIMRRSRVVTCSGGVSGPIGVLLGDKSILENSLVAYNTNTWSSGGAIVIGGNGAVVRNCTVVGNKSKGARAGGLGAESKTVQVVNTVFQDNSSTGAAENFDVSDDANAVFTNCYFTTASILSCRSARCVACDAGDALFAAPMTYPYDFTPQKSSPLKDKGTNDVVFTETPELDVYGLSRRYGVIDIGAAEYHHTGEMACSYKASGQSTPGGAVSFTASVDGAEDPTRLQYRWRVIADGVEWTDWSSSASWTTNLAVGAYRVKLEVNDPDIPKTVSTDMDGAKTFVSSPILHLVDPATPDHAAAEPYDTESNAATNFTDLVAFAGSGTEVVIHPGNHPVKSSVAFENRTSVHGLTANPRDTVLYRPDGTAGFGLLQLMIAGSALSHVTFSNATYASSSKQQGVAFYGLGSVVSNCVFTKTVGNAVKNQDGFVTHSLITDNFDWDYYAAYVQSGKARIAWSTITKTGQDYHAGGGMLLDGGEMDHCRVVDNDLRRPGDQWGFVGAPNGGVVAQNNAVIRNTLIAGNRANCGGGGVAIASSWQTVTLINCTIVSNYVNKGSATDAQPHNGAGGVYNAAGQSTLIISNSIIQGNWTTTGPSQYDNGYFPAGTAKAYQSNVTNFTGCSVYADCINEDPKFRRRHKSPWCLDATSPCRLKCEPYDGAADDVDLFGAPRVFKGKSDMGCYQYIPYGLSIIVR